MVKNKEGDIKRYLKRNAKDRNAKDVEIQVNVYMKRNESMIKKEAKQCAL